MKRIKNIVAGLAALVLGSSFAFADKAQYDKLLAEGKQYEEKGKWCSALGTYWDALGSNPGDAKEAQEGFERIYNVYGEYGYDFLGIPNPGPGEYDDFSRYDGWIELCKDFEIYWNEHPGEIFTTNLKCSKGDVDMKSRTASYDFTLVADYSEKFLRIGTRICFIFRRAYKKYGSDWPDIPEQWPAVSMFKDSKTIPVVKFISAPCEFHTTSNKESYLDLDPYTIAKSYCEGMVYGNSLSFYDKKTTEAYVAAWNNFCAIVPSDKLALWKDDVTDPYKNMSIKVSIKDENGRIIASMSKPDPLGDLSGPRGGPDGFRGKFSSAFTISGISASDIKVLDSGKWTYSIDSFVLTPREATAKAENSGGGFNQGTKLTNVKYKTVSPTIDYLKGNAGFASVNVLEQNKKAMSEQETEKNKASYVQNYFDSRKQTFDSSHGFKWEIKLYTKTLACVRQEGENYNDYKYVIVERKNLDSVGYVKKNTPILGTVDDLLVQLNAMDSKDAKWKFDVYESYVYKDLTESEVIQKKQEYLTQYKKADAKGKSAVVRDVGEWERTSWEKIVSELYEYLSAMQEYDEDKLHAKISDLTLEEKKGVVTVKAVAAEFVSKGLKKKDVITQMSLKEYDGSTRAVTVSELPKIPGQSTLIFTVQRGSGKKAQELTIEVPVEWNGQWTGSNWY